MRSLSLTILLFAGLFSPLSAQIESQAKAAFGVEDREMILRLMPMVPGVGYVESASISEQSLKPYMMPARRMMEKGSPASYLLASCLEYYVNLNENYKVNLSPDYISLNLLSQGKQTDFRGAFEQLAETGTVSAAIMPYGSASITSAVYATQKFRIKNYLILFRGMTRDKEKIFDVRRALLRGNPVVVEVMADPDLQQARGVSQLKLKRVTSGTVFPLIVVGFDEDREAFEVTSPWGSPWGKGGYLWIPYEDLARQAQRAYVMVPEMDF